MGDAYKAAGVDYDRLDTFKRAAQTMAASTTDALKRFGAREVPGTRGESAYLIEDRFHQIWALVDEGLGTKNLVADAMDVPDGYFRCAKDTLAMIVNDMITLGALPMVASLHLQVGSSDWFDDVARSTSLAAGYKAACEEAGCTWGPGETPALKGVVVPGACSLSGAAFGQVRDPKRHLIFGHGLRHGDVIVLVESSGIHANGLTLARSIAAKHPLGFQAIIPDGRTFGEALLTPTRIYVPLIEALQNASLQIHYAVHITGHGFRKLMRKEAPFTYVVEQLPTVPTEFDFIQDKGGVDLKEMYGTFNMGAGFALMLARNEAAAAVKVARGCGFNAWEAGEVIDGDRRVMIPPLKLEYDSRTLNIR